MATLASEIDSPEPTTVREARKFLQDIRNERGFLSDEDRAEIATLRIGTQQAVQGIVKNLRQTLANYTNSIAGESYSEKSRFMYELLQNADDSVYNCGSDGPCVTMNLFPDRFLIETNEIGFTLANVRAICATGESSKKKQTEDNSIGEKGYGFKSVFGVASRARIQSGLWSFYFQYQESHADDNPLGMVTPIDAEYIQLPPGVTTRIELLLHQGSHDLFEVLSQKLRQLHETTIFFLQQIKTLIIHIHPSGRPEEKITFTRSNFTLQPAVLDGIVSLTRKNVTRGQPEIVNTKLYHVLQHNVIGMPPDKHRKEQTTSTLQLAFPFNSADKCPIIAADGQHIFAYLPLYQKSNLHFLIQGDFITLNNRQNVLECAWNSQLLSSVADAFCNAVTRFYQDSILRYQWLKYLPVLLLEGFEKPLFNMIKDRLQSLRVFQTWQCRRPACPSELRIVPTSFIHESVPLFEDLPVEAYLAPEYSRTDHGILNLMGIPYMEDAALVDRLIHDLGSSTSRYRNFLPSNPWHETCASFLIAILSLPTGSPQNDLNQQNIRSQKLIPLRSTRGDCPTPADAAEWINTKAWGLDSEPVYFSETRVPRSQNTSATRDSLPIPRGLPIQVVHEDNSMGMQRRSLLISLGVTTCEPIMVTESIFKLHRQWETGDRPLRTDVLTSHLQYLYWFRVDQTPISSPLFLMSTRNSCGSRVVDRTTRPMYLKSAQRYDTWSLLEDTPSIRKDSLATFLSEKYEGIESENSRSYGRSWEEWLEQIVGVRRRPPLLQRGFTDLSLSPILLHVLKTRPKDFFPTLQAHWKIEYEQVLINTPSAKDVFSRLGVPCGETRTYALKQTYVPKRALKLEAERIGLLKYAPFLKLPDKNEGLWDFLSAFGVGTQITLNFYLDLLDQVRQLDEAQLVDETQLKDMVMKIYSKIGVLCNQDQATIVMQRLRDKPGIYLPSKSMDTQWFEPDRCLWNAPAFLSIKPALVNYYGFDTDISILFRTFLRIGDVQASDYLDQLRCFRNGGHTAEETDVLHATCAQVYQELHKHFGSATFPNHIKETIENEKLIFVDGAWHSPSECLWSTDTSLSDEISIAGIYSNLKAFFVTKLRVEVLTTAMVVADLRKKATARPPLKVADAKQLIFKINNMISRENLDATLQAKFDELRSVECFPVKDKEGHVRLKSTDSDFAINDLDRYGKSLEFEVDFYDFSFDDVHNLRPFIKATRMENQYLSNLVKEVSEVEGSSTKSEELTAHLQSLAYEFFCCAVHFKSSQIIGHDSSLFDKLLRLEVHDAERMDTALVLQQNRREIRVPSTKAEIKVDITNCPWKVYVPKDPRARQACCRSRLYKTIIELLGVSGSGADVPVERLISAELQTAEIRDSILEDHDIQCVSWITRTMLDSRAGLVVPMSAPSFHKLAALPFGGSQNRDVDSGLASGLLGSPFSSANRPNSSALFRVEPGFGSSSQFLTSAAAASSQSPFSTGSVSTSSRPSYLFDTPPSTIADSPPRTNVGLQSEKYVALLGNIIRHAKGEDGVWNFNSLAELLPDGGHVSRLVDKEDIFGVRNDENLSLARNMKIGAAGEVFVVETLLSILPDFTLNNWLSTIRHEAKVHPHYADMPNTSPDLPAGTKEPADIVYADPSGIFLQFLQTQDCVGFEEWLRWPRVPKRKYYIEVKTTTRGCDTAFHMSTAQHTRMLKMRKKTFVPAEDVYIVCRVYNLLSNDIKMRFYLSPGRDADASAGPAPARDDPSMFIFGEAHAAAAAAASGLAGDEQPILSFAGKGFLVTPVRGGAAVREDSA